MVEKKSNNIGIRRALKAVETENENLNHCLGEIIESRKALEINIDSVDCQLASVIQEIYKLQTKNTRNYFKIQTMDKEVNELEGKQNVLTENIKNLGNKSREHKENSDTKINDFARKSENLCALFLSPIQIETTESECAKLFDDISGLKSELMGKEASLFKMQKELEEFVFYGMPINKIEQLVSEEERQFLMNAMEEQLMDARKKFQNLKHIKAAKQVAMELE